MDDRITICGIVYRKEEDKDKSGMPFCIVRSYSAGVFAGYLKSREGKEVVLENAIRLWRWDGAASLSQLAMEGVTKPSGCKFAVPVDTIILTEAIEIIPTTRKARECIQGVKPWRV